VVPPWSGPHHSFVAGAGDAYGDGGPAPNVGRGAAAGQDPTEDRQRLVEDQPRLTVAAVAHRLGVAPATLRTWDRRYGLGPHEHVEGARRRYSPADLARLHLMRRLVLDGVAPAEAAALAVRGPAPPGGEHAAVPPSAGEGEPGQEPAAAQPGAGMAAHGGRVLGLPGASAAVRGLARAALALDDAAARAQIVASVRTSGVAVTWDALLRPVLRALGARWASTGEGVEDEHLLSGAVVAALTEAVPAVVSARRCVLLVSAEDEQHALPLHVLAAALAERGVAARVLGAALPAVALRAAVRRTGPAAVLVWSQLAETAEPAGLAAVPVTRPATAVFAAGPGWAREQLPARVRLLADLPTAVRELAAAAGA